MALFAQFAMAATEEALEDAAWRPTTGEQREATVCSFNLVIWYYVRKSDLQQGVCLGSGIGNFEHIYNTVVDFENNVRTDAVDMSFHNGN
jgi:3-oxoacyl-[acyl-carrier-protein] synthase II